MKQLPRILLVVGLLLSVMACGDEDRYHFPSAVKEFYTAYFGADSTIQYIETDDEVRHEVREDYSKERGAPDSVGRYMGYYERLEQGGVKLYGTYDIITGPPAPLTDVGETLQTDPVKVISIWQAPRYINMHLGVRFAESDHDCAFVIDSIHWGAYGHNRVWMTFYHDAHGAGEGYFTDDAYVSVPVEEFQQQGRQLTIYFSINTFEEGMKQYQFEYNN